MERASDSSSRGAGTIKARLLARPRGRLAERVSAASYGTVLVLAALVLINEDDVVSGLGWELLTGVGVATWAAHLYAEVVGDHLRNSAAHDRQEIRKAMADGLPILLAAVAPAVTLGLGRADILDPRLALWLSLVVALGQLVALGGFVGFAVSGRAALAWRYAAATAAFGVIAVLIKLVLGH